MPLEESCQKNDSSSIRPFTQEDQVAQIEAKSYIQGTLAVSSGGIVYKHYISPQFLFLAKDLWVEKENP